jgi:hypothetical protein
MPLGVSLFRPFFGTSCFVDARHDFITEYLVLWLCDGLDVEVHR